MWRKRTQCIPRFCVSEFTLLTHSTNPEKWTGLVCAKPRVELLMCKDKTFAEFRVPEAKTALPSECRDSGVMEFNLAISFSAHREQKKQLNNDKLYGALGSVRSYWRSPGRASHLRCE